MDLTPWRRTVLVMLLVAIPWFIIGVCSWMVLVHAHLESEVTDWFWGRLAIIIGGVLCLVALAVFVDGMHQKQINPLLVLFALMGFWYLIEWPGKALAAILFS